MPKSFYWATHSTRSTGGLPCLKRRFLLGAATVAAVVGDALRRLPYKPTYAEHSSPFLSRTCDWMVRWALALSAHQNSNLGFKVLVSYKGGIFFIERRYFREQWCVDGDFVNLKIHQISFLDSSISEVFIRIWVYMRVFIEMSVCI
jgi:hypothetical protein